MFAGPLLEGHHGITSARPSTLRSTCDPAPPLWVSWTMIRWPLLNRRPGTISVPAHWILCMAHMTVAHRSTHALRLDISSCNWHAMAFETWSRWVTQAVPHACMWLADLHVDWPKVPVDTVRHRPGHVPLMDDIHREPPYRKHEGNSQRVRPSQVLSRMTIRARSAEKF